RFSRDWSSDVCSSDLYLTARFDEAPGIAVGIPVRKSGIRIGEVVEIQFDRRPGAGDGVLVTMALERKYRLAAGSLPRLSRALIEIGRASCRERGSVCE